MLFLPVKKKVAHENIKFCARKKFFSSREKNEKKSDNCPRKEKVAVKNLKIGPKSGRENKKLPVKKVQKRLKMAFTGTFYFHGEKNTASHYHPCRPPTSWL